jgi:hypothetical protein
MRWRKSSKLKSMMGSVSAMEGAAEKACDGPETEELKRFGVIVLAIFKVSDGNLVACARISGGVW